MKRNLLNYLMAGMALYAVESVARANTIVTFSVNMATNLANGSFNPPPPAGTGTNGIYVFGTFNGFAGPGLQLVQVGSSTVYTNTVNDTNDVNGKVMDYKFKIDGNVEGSADYDNRAAYVPANSGASLILPTPFYGDVGPGVSPTVTFQLDMSEEIELGHFNPGNGDTVDVRGSFNGWSYNSAYVLTNNPTIIVTNNGVAESNVYTLTVPITAYSAGSGLPSTNSEADFKYVEDPAGAWENPGSYTANDAGNRFFVNNTNQVLPLVSYSDIPYAPLANVTFRVDMSAITHYDTNFASGSVSVWGTFNNWSAGVPLTNNPASTNSNIYSGVSTAPEGIQFLYQFRYTNSALNAWVYDYSRDGVYNDGLRRTATLPVTSSSISTNLPLVYFLDLAPDDLLPVNTPVQFSIDMTGAVDTSGYVFNPNSDGVYINGMFANAGGYPQAYYMWAGGVNPVSAPPGFQMIRSGSTSIFTNTIIMPAGTTVGLQYQYGIDPGNQYGGPSEDEAPSGYNHIRVIRTTKTNVYVMPTDKFTNAPYQEPLFAPGNIYEGIGTLDGGQLHVNGSTNGHINVAWLGRPGAHLQMKTNLSTGSWVDLPLTDGTNWNAGVSTANGLLSVTNWPSVSGNAYFRLIKP